MTTQPATFAEWFGAELDKRLVNMSPAEAMAYLRQQERYWTFRAARFHGSKGESETIPHPDYGTPDAFDFRLFLSAIEKRIVARREVAA